MVLHDLVLASEEGETFPEGGWSQSNEAMPTIGLEGELLPGPV